MNDAANINVEYGHLNQELPQIPRPYKKII